MMDKVRTAATAETQGQCEDREECVNGVGSLHSEQQACRHVHLEVVAVDCEVAAADDKAFAASVENLKLGPEPLG
jgi:hypothetical protein